LQAGQALAQIEQGDSWNAAAALMVGRDQFEKVVRVHTDYADALREVERLRKRLARTGTGRPRKFASDAERIKFHNERKKAKKKNAKA
jgi:hypothetical protein